MRALGGTVDRGRVWKVPVISTIPKSIPNMHGARVCILGPRTSGTWLDGRSIAASCIESGGRGGSCGSNGWWMCCKKIGATEHNKEMCEQV